MKGPDDGQFERRKTRVGEEQLEVIKVAGGGVDADRQVQRLRRRVERKEVGIGDALIVLEGAHKHAAGAVLLAEMDFLQGFFAVALGLNSHPPQTLRNLPPYPRQPPVVAPPNPRLNLYPP